MGKRASEREWALVVFSCAALSLSAGHHWGAISLANMAPGKYMSVSVSARNSESRPLA